MIRVSKLTKDYGLRRAISELDFHIEKSEIVGFLGPNGAGKTTTMRILAGYMPPTEGDVKVNGFDIIEDSLEVRKTVGYLPETVPLYTDMTVTEYLEYMASLRHVKNKEQRVNEIIEMVQMGSRADSLIGNLSKGLRQRVGLAQALIHRPEVLILDEPTIGLDPAQIIDVRNLIREVGREHTVLLSTHILSEAQQVCNRILIINKGKIVAEDTTQSLQMRLTGAQRVSLRLRGDAPEAAEKVKNIRGVINVKAVDDELIEFESAPGNDIRAEVARNIVTEGFDLLELRPLNMSLEDIFLELTRDETPSPAEYTEPSPIFSEDGSR